MLTWTILNKRMYHRYVYLEFHQYIPECILKLRQTMQPDVCSAMAHRLIRFDEDMTSTAKSWCDTWSLLQDYHMSKFDWDRRHRIFDVHKMFKQIRDCNYDLTPYDAAIKQEKATRMKWIKLEDRDDAWAAAINYMKSDWDEKGEERLHVTVQTDKCKTCLPIIQHQPYVFYLIVILPDRYS